VVANVLSAAPPTVILNELHYHPADDSLSGEFVELYNHGDEDVDVGGWVIAGGIEHMFAHGTVVPAGGFVLVAADADLLAARYGLDPALIGGEFDRTLSNNGELVQLWTSFGHLASFVDYEDSNPWPESPDISRPDAPASRR